MSRNKTVIRGDFFGRIAAVCAAWAVVAAPANGQSQAGGAEAKVNVTDYETVDLAVQDTDLAQVLQMLSIQSQKNIITSKSVSATVTANLFDVTFYEALDAILRVNGFRYMEEGNFIYIYTESEFQDIVDASRKTETRTYQLDYLSAVDANEFITPLLSEAGKASYRGEVTPGYQPDISNGGEDSFAYTPTLVVNDYPENLEAIAALIDELDVAPTQVLVEATILQTALDEANAFGVDFTILGSANFSVLDVFNPLSAVNGLLSKKATTTTNNADGGSNGRQALALDSTVGGTAGPAGLKIGILTDDISVFLKVLDEVSDTTVLARPKVMVLNRQRAEVLVGTRIGYLSTTATQTTTTQTVSFLDTGIQLVFRPFISSDGMVRMELSPSVSEASLRTVTDANGLLVTIPDELTNELTTNVRIMDGQTLVLGGLYRESTRTTRRQIPFFGDIPLIGAAFRGQEDTVDRDEIIFLITPTIVKDDLLWEIGEEATAYGEAIQIGAREGLLPFSRDKVTANHNQRAVDAQSRGDIDLALWHIKASLHLNPNQPEAVRFRQDLVGSKDRPHERSGMERAFRSRMAPSLQSQANATTFPLPMTMPQNPFAAGAASDLPDDGWLQSVAEAQPEAGDDADRQVEFNEPVAGAEPPPLPDDFESAVLWDDDFGSPMLPETQEFSPEPTPEPIQEDPNSWFAPSASESDDPSNSAEPPEERESAVRFVPPPPFKDEASVFIGDSGYDDVIDGFVPPPSVKEEPSKFVRSSGYERADQRIVVPPPVKDEASQFIRGAPKATADPWNPQFSQLSGQRDEFQPIPNAPVSINTPNIETRVDPSSHSISEQFVPGFGHHHVFWWMGWDPAAADAHAWEDPFPFVTFDYLPHVVSVPETPER